MATIVTRAGKGSPLTHNEVDANFNNLNSDKIESNDTVASLTLTTVDINGGTIDDTVIGGSTPAAISGTTITATGDVDVADKITHTGDTDTSIRFPAADTVTVETAGSERVRVDSNGNVGIGTSSPAYPLHVSGATTGIAWINSNNSNTGAADGAGFLGSNNGVNSVLYSVSGFAGLSGTTTNHPFVLVTNNTERMRIDSSGNVGIGTSSPSTPLDVSADSSSLNLSLAGSSTNVSIARFMSQDRSTTYALIRGASNEFRLNCQANAPMTFYTNNTERMRIDSSGNVGIGTSSPSEKLSVTGNVTISGSLSKGSGSFKIDHPIKPETHHLVHSFIEGPQADNIYRGKVALVGGTATVNLDEAGRMAEGTFVALNGNVQCFTTNEDGWTAVRGKVDGNILTIEAQDATCTDTVSWLVIGERHDQHMIDANWTDEQGRIITEPEKETAS